MFGLNSFDEESACFKEINRLRKLNYACILIGGLLLVFNMLMTAEKANTDLPLYRFSILFLIGTKYDRATLPLYRFTAYIVY